MTCENCSKDHLKCKCVCRTCGNQPMSGVPIRSDGKCKDCHRHPPGTSWKGGTVPIGCDLYVMPKGWKPGNPIPDFS